MEKGKLYVDWTDKCEQAKNAVLNDIITSGLMMPEWGKPFVLETDFSYDGIGAVLLQEKNGIECPVMFASRQLIDAETRYSPTEGEALGILFGLKRFSHVLFGQHVKIRTDHRPLTFIKQGCEHNRKLARWWAELQEYDFELEYVKGDDNLAADCLSRSTTCNEVTIDSALFAAWTISGEVDDTLGQCSQCNSELEDDCMECDKCGKRFHMSCCDPEALELPFWYCSACGGDDKEPTMNALLLKCLTPGMQIQTLVDEFGYDKVQKVLQLAE